MKNVLVIFQADTESTEQMALAVGVGAVEAEASIRLRRLAGPGAAEVAHKGYGKLQRADLRWANVVVVGLESATPRADELDGLFLLLSEIEPGEFDGKKAWTFSREGLATERSEAQILVESALESAGIAIVQTDDLRTEANGDLIGRLKYAGQAIARNPF